MPRPSSSRMTSERGVASERIFFVSESSTKNVDWAAKMLSLAPSRDIIRSMGVRRAELEGTKQPIWAMTTAMQVCRYD